MRILRAAGMAALTVGVVVAAATAQKTSRGTPLPPFLYPAKPKVEETAAPTPPRPEPPDRKVVLQKLEDVQQRRLRVIDELRRVADEQNDDKLRDEADQLEQRAWDAYVQRTAQVPTEPVSEARGKQAGAAKDDNKEERR